MYKDKEGWYPGGGLSILEQNFGSRRNQKGTGKNWTGYFWAK